MATVYDSGLSIPEDKTFSLKDKALKLDDAKDVQPYLAELAKMDDVQKVDLSGNTISPEASKAIAAELAKFKDSLQEINLQDIYTSRDRFEIPASLKEFFPVIEEMPHLRVINLSDNALGQDAIEVIEDFIGKTKYIEHLIISNNGLGPFSGARVGKALYKSAKLREAEKAVDDDVRTLKTFWCGRNRLENGSTDYLSLGLKANKDLKDIRLYQNGIRPKGIAKLIRHGLADLDQLEVLDLDDNTFTLPGSAALAETLAHWPELKELNVNDCLLKAKGGVKVLEKLIDVSGKSKIEHIKMQYNELDPESLKALVKLLPNLKNHKTLEINGNIFDEDAEELDKIRSIFDVKGHGELDELDDLEEPDSEEEDDEDEDDSDADDSDEEEDEKEEAEEDLKEVKDALAKLEAELEQTHI